MKGGVYRMLTSEEQHDALQNLNNQVFHISSFLKQLKLYSETFFRDVPKRL